VTIRGKILLYAVALAFGGCSAIAFGADSVLLGGDSTYISIAALIGIATILVGGIRLLSAELRAIRKDINGIEVRLAGEFASTDSIDRLDQRLRVVELRCASEHRDN